MPTDRPYGLARRTYTGSNPCAHHPKARRPALRPRHRWPCTMPHGGGCRRQTMTPHANGQRARWRHRPRAEPMTPGPCNHSVAATTSHPLAPQGLLTPRRMRQNKTSGPHGSCHAGLTFCFGASGGALAGLGAQAGGWWWLPRYGCTAQASLAPPEGGAAIVPVDRWRVAS